MATNYLRGNQLAENLAGAQALTNFLDASDRRPLTNQVAEQTLQAELATQQAIPEQLQLKRQQAYDTLDQAKRDSAMKVLANAALDLDNVADPAEKAARYQQIRQIEAPNWQGAVPWADEYSPQVQAVLDHAKNQVYGEQILKSRLQKPDAAKLSGIGQLISERDALPEGDARRQIYDSAIQKQIAAAQTGGSEGDYGQFLVQPDGTYLFGSRRTGEVKPVALDGTPVKAIAGDPNAQRALSAARESGQVEAKARTEAEINLPSVISNADQTTALIDRLLEHPGLPKSTGLRGAIPSLPGSDARNFEVALDQLKGKTFLEAYASLKGAGAITDIEGRKAEDAIAALDRAQSEAEFKKALKDLGSVVQAGKVRSQVKAGQGRRETDNQPSPKRLRFNPQTGELE